MPASRHSSPTTDTTFVFVHGICLGGWTWHPVAQLLTEAGHRAVALTMPGLNYGDPVEALRLTDAVDHLVAEVQRRTLNDVVLVGHSWGGYPVTGAAHQLGDRVRRVVYYNAVVPSRNVALAEESDELREAFRLLLASSPDATVPLPLEALQQVLMPDESPELQLLVHQLSHPQPAGYVLDGLDVPTVVQAGIPASYILGRDDVSLVHPGKELAARIAEEPISISGTHMTLLSRPKEVAAAIIGAVDG